MIEEEQAWLKAALQGDESGYEKIFRHYERSLFNLARRIVKDPKTAEDVLQESFIKAFRHLSSVRKDRSLGPWLRKIVYRTSIDAVRRYKRRREAPLDTRIDMGVPPGLNPEKEAMVQERVDMVDQALQALSPRYRTYIVLREVDGLSYKEIAQTLDVPLSTVRITLHRARKQLHELLRQMAGEEA